jgi:hypothetical protein
MRKKKTCIAFHKTKQYREINSVYGCLYVFWHIYYAYLSASFRPDYHIYFLMRFIKPPLILRSYFGVKQLSQGNYVYYFLN